MHNLKLQHIRDIAQKITTVEEDNTSDLLALARELYENSVLYTHRKDTDEARSGLPESDNRETEPVVASFEKTETSKPEITPKPELDEKELSIQERIREIMEKARAEEKPDKRDDVVFSPKIEPETEKITPAQSDTKPAQETSNTLKTTLEEEFKDAISADFATELFEKAEKIEITKKSLNDKLSQNHIQIGLNDRIAFVKHLFNGNQSDFNRVLSQLNTFETEAEAKHFLATRVKPEYNWTNKEDYETRFIHLIERRFL